MFGSPGTFGDNRDVGRTSGTRASSSPVMTSEPISHRRELMNDPEPRTSVRTKLARIVSEFLFWARQADPAHSWSVSFRPCAREDPLSPTCTPAVSRPPRPPQGPSRESAVERSELEGFSDLANWGIRPSPTRPPLCTSRVSWRPGTGRRQVPRRRSCRATGRAHGGRLSRR